MKKKWIGIMMAAVVAGMTACGSTGTDASGSAAGAGQTEQSKTESSSSATDSSEAQKEVQLTMTWWGSQTRADLTQQALALYEEQNPGITFDGQFLSGADYWNKLATSAAGHTMADIVQMDKSYIQQYVDNSMLVDLQPYVDSGVIDLSNVDASVQDYGKIDGGLYWCKLSCTAV